ncbi:COG3709 Uncharacterized component of phosphonate metabolism [Rhabdaerophilaceae bacterium]
MTISSAARPTRSIGMFVAIVGPSGAGKDTIITGLRPRLPADRFFFPRRLITRQADTTEDSQYLPEPAFFSSKIAGEFLISWEANGLHYAIAREARAELELGRHVLANLSRNAIPSLKLLLPRVLVVHVTARRDVLEERLRLRGREVTEMQLERLDRGLRLDAAVEADIRIENNGPPEQAIIALLNVLTLLPPPASTLGAAP